MGRTSYLRFNPDTKEIEIEGSEEFIKLYFDKLQKMLLQTQAEMKKDQEADIALPVEKTMAETKATAKIPATKKAGKVERKKTVATGLQQLSQFDKVVGLIQGRQNGITTSELTEKTGLTRRQIWGITSRALKFGKIKKAKRGLYLPWL